MAREVRRVSTVGPPGARRGPAPPSAAAAASRRERWGARVGRRASRGRHGPCGPGEPSGAWSSSPSVTVHGPAWARVGRACVAPRGARATMGSRPVGLHLGWRAGLPRRGALVMAGGAPSGADPIRRRSPQGWRVAWGPRPPRRHRSILRAAATRGRRPAPGRGRRADRLAVLPRDAPWALGLGADAVAGT